MNSTVNIAKDKSGLDEMERTPQEMAEWIAIIDDEDRRRMAANSVSEQRPRSGRIQSQRRPQVATTIHFIDVGQGNMVLVQCANGTNFMVDCNITDANDCRVLNYVANQIGRQGRLRAFICTHRDADHMRGVRDLHRVFPIQEIWDAGYPGTTTDSDEYKEYMKLRRELKSYEIRRGFEIDFGRTRFRFLSSKDSRLPDNANDQGLVLKVEQRNSDMSRVMASTILTGDGSYAVWKDGIMKDYSTGEVSCNILMAAHHGSLDFFDDPNDSQKYYTAHVKAMSPAMAIVSVGPNNYGHPDATALRLYRENSTGLDNGDKTYRTDHQHTVKLTLRDGGGSSVATNQ